MAQQSSIEWTDLTWNPVVGCSIESAGCKNCYAMRMAARLQSMGHEKYQGLTKKSKRGAVWTDKVRCHENRWKFRYFGKNLVAFLSIPCRIYFILTCPVTL